MIQRHVPRPSLNQATKHVEISQTQYIDKVAAVPTVTQRQVPATKHAEISQTQYINKFVAVLIVIQRQGPQFQTVLKTVEAPPWQFIGRAMDASKMSLRSVFLGRLVNRSTTLSLRF